MLNLCVHAALIPRPRTRKERDQVVTTRGGVNGPHISQLFGSRCSKYGMVAFENSAFHYDVSLQILKFFINSSRSNERIIFKKLHFDPRRAGPRGAHLPLGALAVPVRSFTSSSSSAGRRAIDFEPTDSVCEHTRLEHDEESPQSSMSSGRSKDKQNNHQHARAASIHTEFVVRSPT